MSEDWRSFKTASRIRITLPLLSLSLSPVGTFMMKVGVSVQAALYGYKAHIYASISRYRTRWWTRASSAPARSDLLTWLVGLIKQTVSLAASHDSDIFVGPPGETSYQRARIHKRWHTFSNLSSFKTIFFSNTSIEAIVRAFFCFSRVGKIFRKIGT